MTGISSRRFGVFSKYEINLKILPFLKKIIRTEIAEQSILIKKIPSRMGISKVRYSKVRGLLPKKKPRRLIWKEILAFIVLGLGSIGRFRKLYRYKRLIPKHGRWKS